MAEKIFYGAAQDLRIMLTDSINAGKNPLEILLAMAKILGEISGEDSYYSYTREQILAVYGFALNEKFVLQKEIEEVSRRLKKIEAAIKNSAFTDEEHKRMGYALERHKEEIARLESLTAENFGEAN